MKPETNPIDSKRHLCKRCKNNFATCNKTNHIKFGDGAGNDNAIECSGFVISLKDK